MLLTDETLLNYKRCQRRAYLNVHGDIQAQDGESDFIIKLRQENRQHIEHYLDQLEQPWQKPIGEDLESRAISTIDLMSQGVEIIYRPVLQGELNEVALISKPTLLVKYAAPSAWGPWSYYPIIIKLGRKAKSEYKLIAAFASYLLGQIQEKISDHAMIILHGHKTHRIIPEYWLEKLEDSLIGCSTILRDRQEPEVFISRQKCSLCSWQSHCYTIAQQHRHLSLLPGVTPQRFEYLQTIGIHSLEALATISPQAISPDLGLTISHHLIQHAQATLTNQPLWKYSHHPNHLVKPLPQSSIEIYFDIEAEPVLGVDYLLGALVIDREHHTEKFHGLLAKEPAQEREIWEHFLTLTKSYPQAPIFHFSGYEVDVIKRLGRVYQTPRPIIQNLVDRCWDLHAYLTKFVVLPIENYSLKTIASWIGFQWRDDAGNGAQSIYWYDQWLKTQNHQYLEFILTYNEDDCQATYCLKNWLDQFVQKHLPSFKDTLK
jgi:uncharacterized protein